MKLPYKILVGSSYFFKEIEGFKGADIDYVILEKNPTIYKYYYQRRSESEDIFKWNIDTILDYDYSRNPMAIGKFLVPEVLKELGLQFSEVEKLIEKHIYNLNQKHQYQVAIFEFYKKNKKMRLTKKQRMEVYEIYLKNKNK